MKKLLLILLYINLFALDNKKVVLHNSTPFKIEIAIGYYNGEDWISEGWFHIKSNKDLTFYTKNRIFYYRARSYYKTFNWYPSNSQSSSNFYVIDQAFKIRDKNPPSNVKVQPFKKVIIPKNKTSYTLDLTYGANNIHFVKPQDCVCHKDYIALKNSINPSKQPLDTSIAKTTANALSTLPTSDYCSQQASNIIYLDSKIYSVIAESYDKCGNGFIEGFFTGFFEPWKGFITCPNIMHKTKELIRQWKGKVKLYDEWYQGNCTN